MYTIRHNIIFNYNKWGAYNIIISISALIGTIDERAEINGGTNVHSKVLFA